jgi:hypothetical protein
LPDRLPHKVQQAAYCQQRTQPDENHRYLHCPFPGETLLRGFFFAGDDDAPI